MGNARDLRRHAARAREEAVAQAEPASRTVEPFGGTIADAMTAAGFVGPSWRTWRTLIKAAFGMRLEPEEILVYQRHTARTMPPQHPAHELWILAGRRSGKTRVSALVALYVGIRRNYAEVAGPGEKVVIPIVCADRRQARQQIGFLRGLLALPIFRPYLKRLLKERIDLASGCVIEVSTCDHRLASRGFTCPMIVADEVAHWRSEQGTNLDVEVIRSLRPSMLTITDSLLWAASSPYAARGALFDAAQGYGQDNERVLCFNADTLSLHPTADVAEIERMWAEDPLAAASEFGRDGHVSFRADVAALFDVAAIDAAIAAGCYELPYREGVTYMAACDPSGGVADDMVLSIGHTERDGTLVVDLLRVVRPRFDPATAAAEFAEELRVYHVSVLHGDRYSAGWCEGEFRRLGISYVPSEQTASEAFRTLLAVLNSGKVRLLDHKRLRGQLVQLERKMTATGRETIGHPQGAHDDVAACVALLVSVLQAAEGSGGPAWAFIGGRIVDLSTGKVAPRADWMEPGVWP